MPDRCQAIEWLAGDDHRDDAHEAADRLVDRFSRLVPGLPVTAEVTSGGVPRHPGHPAVADRDPPETGRQRSTDVIREHENDGGQEDDHASATTRSVP